jgi:hypothetical protein
MSRPRKSPLTAVTARESPLTVLKSRFRGFGRAPGQIFLVGRTAISALKKVILRREEQPRAFGSRPIRGASDETGTGAWFGRTTPGSHDGLL